MAGHNWCNIHYTPSTGLEKLLEQYDKLFQDKLGKFQGRQAKIEVDPQATPRFCKARTLPYSMRSKVEEEIDRLVSEGILEPVEYAEWAALVVAVLKCTTVRRLSNDCESCSQATSASNTESGRLVRNVARRQEVHEA